MAHEDDGDAPKQVRYPLNRGQRRRRRLVNAAAELYREEGREGVTQRAVAKLADSSLSAMTYYFADLVDMIDCAIRQGVRDRIRHLVRQTADPASLGATPAQAIVEVLVPHGGPDRPWRALENLVGVGDVPAIQIELDHMYRHMDAALAAVWGHFALAAPWLPRQIIALVHGVIALTPPGGDPRDAARRAVSDYLAAAQR